VLAICGILDTPLETPCRPGLVLGLILELTLLLLVVCASGRATGGVGGDVGRDRAVEGHTGRSLLLLLQVASMIRGTMLKNVVIN
jgi:hypothetical protein